MELFYFWKEIEIIGKLKVNLLIPNIQSTFLGLEVNVATMRRELTLVSEVTNDLPNSHIVNVETCELYKEFVLVKVTSRVDLFSCWRIKRFQ
jgi:hypothetical protein